MIYWDQFLKMHLYFNGLEIAISPKFPISTQFFLDPIRDLERVNELDLKVRENQIMNISRRFFDNI